MGYEGEENTDRPRQTASFNFTKVMPTSAMTVVKNNEQQQDEEIVVSRNNVSTIVHRTI